MTELHNFAGGPDRPRGNGSIFGQPLTCAGSNGRYGPGQSFNSMSAVIVDGEVTSSGILTPNGTTATCTPVPASSEATLAALPTDGRARTITIDGFGDYRAVATTLADGSVLINGLPLASVQASLVQLGIIMGIVTGIALLAGGFAVYWIVRRSLRPLDRVVADGPPGRDPAAGSRRG